MQDYTMSLNNMLVVFFIQMKKFEKVGNDIFPYAILILHV